MHTVHGGLSVAAVVQPDKINVINTILAAFNSNPGGNSQMPLAQSPTTHFASALIVPAQNDTGKEMPATLLFFTSYSGPFNIHLDELVRIGKNGLVNLFINCVDFPKGSISDNALKQYIIMHRKADTFYSGMQHITHTDIGREQKLRVCIENYLDSNNGFKGLPDVEVRKSIQAFIGAQKEYLWAKQPYKKTFGDFWALWGKGIVVGICVILCLIAGSSLVSSLLGIGIFFSILLLVVLLLATAGLLLVCYRISEINDPYVAPRQPDQKVRAILSTQNHPVINEMTMAGPLKKGWIHPLTLNLVLRVVSLIRGVLTIPTIATARWLTIDEGNRLIFISNFGNLSESYVRDFIDAHASASKINLLFGQGHGYPTTKWMVQKGSLTNPDGFLNDVHKYQQITKFWYWPYMDLSIENINSNRQIRQGLFAQLDEKGIRNWLQLF